jgi:hypothetical protein
MSQNCTTGYNGTTCSTPSHSMPVTGFDAVIFVGIAAIAVGLGALGRLLSRD